MNRQKIKIGISAKIEGDQYSVHTNTFIGAVEHWNATQNNSFELVSCNDEANYAGGKKAADFLLAQNVKAVVGHFASEAAKGALQTYAGHHFPVLLPAATADYLPKIYPHTFRICSKDSRLARFIVNDLSGYEQSISLHHDLSDHGINMVQCIESYLEGSPLKQVEENAVADIKLYSGNFKNSLSFFEKHKNTHSGVFVFTDDVVHQQFKNYFDRPFKCKVYGYKPFLDRVHSSEIAALFSSRFPEGYGTYYGETFAALQVISQSIEGSEVKISENKTYDTVLGPLAFVNREVEESSFACWMMDEAQNFAPTNNISA